MYESRNSAYPLRKELVGKRFLAIEEVDQCARNVCIENLDWKAGFIRACDLTDSSDRELQVLVEFDGVSWEYRKWWKIHEDTQVFLVEHSIISAQRVYHDTRNVISWPAITFVPLVDNLGLNTEGQHPIEFFGDKYMSFVTENDVIPFKESDKQLEQILCLDPRVESDLRAWRRLQQTQAFLMNGAVTLTGLRVTVYRLELRQWYTGCITAHNLSTRELHVMDDNVLQTHPENPALVQINLLANDDELQRLLHGEQWKVLPVRKHRPSQICLQANNNEAKTRVQEGLTSWHMLREISSSPQSGGWNQAGLFTGGGRKGTSNWNGDKNSGGAKRSRRISSRQDMLREQALPQTTTVTTTNKRPSKPVIIHKPVAVHPVEAAIPYAYAIHSGSSQRLAPPPQVHAPSSLGQATLTPTLHTRPTERIPPSVNRVPRQQPTNIYDKTQNKIQTGLDNDSRVSSQNMTYTAVKAPSKARDSKQSTTAKSTNDTILSPKPAFIPEPKKKATTQISPNQLASKPSPIADRISCVDNVVAGSVSKSSHAKQSHAKTRPIANNTTHFTDNAEPKSTKQIQNMNAKTTDTHSSIVNTLPCMPLLYSTSYDPSNTLQPPKTALQPTSSNARVPSTRPQSTSVLQTTKISSPSPGKATSAATNKPSLGSPRARSHTCLHKNTISSVQLQHLKLLEGLAEYQLRLARDAFTTIKMTRSEEQFFLVVDFFHKLAEENRDMIDMCGDLAKRRVEEEKSEHRLHETKQDHIVLNRTKQSLPESVKMQLKTANDEAMSKKEKVLLWVQDGMLLGDYEARSMRDGNDTTSANTEQRQSCENSPKIQHQQQNVTQSTAEDETEKQQKSRRKTKSNHVSPQPSPQEQLDELRLKHSSNQTKGEYLLKQPLIQITTDGTKRTSGQLTRVLNKSFQHSTTTQEAPLPNIPPLYSSSSKSPDQLLNNLSAGTVRNITDKLELTAGNIEKLKDGLKNKATVDSCEPKARDIRENEAIVGSNVEQSSTLADDNKIVRAKTTSQRGDKRKSGEQDVQAIKPKRQRRSKKYQNKELVPSLPVITTITTSTPQDGRTPVKVALAGGNDNRADLLYNNDRPLLPEKVIPPEVAAEVKSSASPGSYQPRSITKGIGFVPTTSNNETAGTMSGSSSNCGLDVLASVSASLSNSEESPSAESGKTVSKQKHREKKKKDGQMKTKKKKHSAKTSENTVVTSSTPLSNVQTVFTSSEVLNNSNLHVTSTHNNFDDGNNKTDTSVSQTERKTVSVSLEAVASTKKDRARTMGTDDVEQTREEAKENNFDDKSIVFVNDSSVGSFVKANVVAEDNVFNECLRNRKKQHNKRKNTKRKKTNIENNEQLTSSYGQESTPMSEDLPNEEGTLSRRKMKKNAIKKTDKDVTLGGTEAVGDVAMNGEPRDIGDSKDESRDSVTCMKMQNEGEQERTLEIEASTTNDKTKVDTTKDDKKVVKRSKGRPKEEWSYFLQKGDCKSVPQMNPCRECRKYKRVEDAIMMQSCCRFSMFRRCRRKRNKMEVAGFLCSDNAQSDDFKPWIARDDVADSLTLEMSKYILRNVGDEFCNLVKQEKEAILLSDNKENMAWKRAVCGIREMCDACATTIFNVHWVCAKCGFGVCLDCYKTKIYPQSNTVDGKKPKFFWVRCTPSSWHRPQKLLLAHIIPKQTLFEVGDELHKAREFWGIGENCPCKSHTTGEKSLIKIEGACENDKHTLNKIEETPAVKQETELHEHKAVASSNDNPFSDNEGKSGIQMDVGDTVIMDNGTTLPMNVDNARMSRDNVVVHMDSDDELDTLGNDTMGALSLVMDYTSPMSSPPTSPVNLMAINIMALATPAEATLASRPSATSAQSSCNLQSMTDEPRDHPSSDQPASPNNAPTEDIPSTEKEANVSDNQAETTEPMNTDARVTTSNAEITSGSAEIRSGNAEISSGNAEITSGSAEITSGSAEITSSNAEIPSSNAEIPPSNAEIPPSNAKVTDSNAEITSGNEKTTDSNADITFNNAEITTSNTEITTSNTEVSSGKARVTCGNTNVTSRNAENAPCNAEVPSDNALVTDANTEITDTNAVVTDSSTTCVSDDPTELRDCGPVITEELPAPHSWICTRPMLRLHDAQHEGNLKSFQSRWGVGEPVVVSNVHKRMNQKLWTPDVFAEEFGHEKADVVNCKNGTTIEKLDIGTFWRGFESVKDRPLDNKGESTLLKLKDWPPEADFLYKMPKRFEDLNNALPLPEYTTRTGSRNLVSRLPDFFVKPDLGPKMYNAYGNAAFPSAGTTNLHIDMSDAVNVMVYVGVPKDEGYGDQERKDTLSCVDVSCDRVQQIRARDPDEQLGALWHIFAAEDANTIRKFFHKLVKEKNMKYPSNHDPIHDQCFYLDEPLLKRLKDEYGVVGWPIAQFLGDAVFIPAGAPHQVRNLHSCVKVAEDFVSPEHVGHCFELTQEFRHLSDKHTNHEDKLQVKNIIYHAVKDAVNVLRHHERELRTTSQNDTMTDDIPNTQSL